MKNTDLAYLAGLMDGEGCLVACTRSPNEKSREKNLQLSLQIKIQMCDKNIIEKIKEMTNMGTIYEFKPKNLNHNISWSWNLRMYEARELLPKLIPYLILKKEQAKLFVKLLTLREAGNKNRGNFEEQLKLQKQIQNFNKRGKEKNATDVRISV